MVTAGGCCYEDKYRQRTEIVVLDITMSLCLVVWLSTGSKKEKQHGFLSHPLKQAFSSVRLLFSEMKTFHRIPCRETSTQPEFAGNLKSHWEHALFCMALSSTVKYRIDLESNQDTLLKQPMSTPLLPPYPA